MKQMLLESIYFGKAGRAGGRSSSCSGQEESSCSAGAVVEETKTGPCSLYKTRKRYSSKGPDPLFLNVSCPSNYHSALVQRLSSGIVRPYTLFLNKLF